MSEELDYDVQGILALQGNIAHGWCHSPQLPGRPLRVEILADGVVVATGIAARLQLELVRPGITEGYHGFALPLPETALEGVMLEARERATGQVFARRLPVRATDVGAWSRDISLLGRGLNAMHAMLGQQKPAHTGLAEALGTVGGVYAAEDRPIQSDLYAVPPRAPAATSATLRVTSRQFRRPTPSRDSR